MEPAVYILASQTRGTLYIGVTSNLMKRLHEHRMGTAASFSRRHGVTRLVHIETFAAMAEAIAREKQLKRWHRDWKIGLIDCLNPQWRDLAADLGLQSLRPKRSPDALCMDPETSSG